MKIVKKIKQVVLDDEHQDNEKSNDKKRRKSGS